MGCNPCKERALSKTVIIIPARYASTRLNAKALIEVKGKPVIQWVWEKACGSKLADDVIIATDHKEIYDCAKKFGANVEMTSENHKSGSDRIAEVAKKYPEFDFIVNLQGDEPLITPQAIDNVVETLKNNDCDISTLVRRIDNQNDIADTNCVKCIFDNNNRALYFSRCPIPFERNKGFAQFYAHIGIYGYRREALIKMTRTPQCHLEQAESLEQLRALYNGMTIKICEVDFTPIGIDTKEDLERFKKALNI